MAVIARTALAVAFGLIAAPGLAQDAPDDTRPTLVPPTGAVPGTFSPVEEPDIWIFSGVLGQTKETYSGTLVSGKTDTDFELKLADGATCDGSDLKGDIGMVRLSEIPCTDGRKMHALFVPQGGDALKVFGRVGDAHFTTSAHLLGTEPIPDRPQTAQPTVPHVLPQIPPGTP